MCSGTCFGMFASILTFLVAWSHNTCIYIYIYISEICAPIGLCQFCYITVVKMICPNPWQCCLFPTIQGHPDEAWLTHQLNFRGCPEAPWKDQCHVFIKANEFVQFSPSLALQDFVFLQSGNQAWFNWILLGNPCPVTATKEPRFRVRPVLDPAGHGGHETLMDLPWSRFSNFQPLKHEDIPTQYEDASNTLEAQFCSWP